MNHRLVGSLPPLVAVIAFASLTAPPATAQPQTAASDGAASPRTTWDHPDLQGIWNNFTITPLERLER